MTTARHNRRGLTEGEISLATSVFGAAIDYAKVGLINRKWAFFQPRGTVMSPRGCIHFHPRGGLWCEDFSTEHVTAQGLFIHEMVHVWQHQRGIFLPLARHPFCRYDYTIRPGVPLDRYGIEQQAEIVRHAFLLSRNVTVCGAPKLSRYGTIIPFKPFTTI